MEHNQSDDHIQSDGVLVNLSPLTPLDREVALDTFGRSWAVTTSWFQYPASENTATYTDTNFVPVYLSNLIVTPQAMNVSLGAKRNILCARWNYEISIFRFAAVRHLVCTIS